MFQHLVIYYNTSFFKTATEFYLQCFKNCVYNMCVCERGERKKYIYPHTYTHTHNMLNTSNPLWFLSRPQNTGTVSLQNSIPLDSILNKPSKFQHLFSVPVASPFSSTKLLFSNRSIFSIFHSTMFLLKLSNS